MTKMFCQVGFEPLIQLETISPLANLYMQLMAMAGKLGMQTQKKKKTCP